MNGDIVVIDGASLVKLFADMLNDMLLVASMYHSGYPFDEDHKQKQQDLFDRAHHLLGITLEVTGQMVGWLVPTERTLDDYGEVW